MGSIEPCLFLILLLVMGCSCDQKSRFAEARPLSSLTPQQSYSETFEKLGMLCKCCDEQGVDCKNTWDGSCSNLQCLPWKLQ